MRRALMALAAFVSLLFGAAPSAGQEAEIVRIREVRLGSDGTTTVVVSVSGEAAGQPLTTGNFSIVENGTEIAPADLRPYIGSGNRPIAAAIVLDTSASMQGQPLLDAKAAAMTFLDGLPAEVRVGLVTFDAQARTTVGFTTDRGAVRNAIAGLAARGETALYDAVVLATNELDRIDAQANMVVLSDGGDTVSGASLDAALEAARKIEAAVTTVGLTTPEIDPQALATLAGETDGSYVPVEGSNELAAAFHRAARELTSQVLLTYKGVDATSPQLDVRVALTLGSLQASDGAVVLNSRTLQVPPPRAEVGAGLFGSDAMLLLALALLGAATAVLLIVLFGGPRADHEMLERAVTLHTPGRRAASTEESDETEGSPARHGLRGRLVGVVDLIPKPQGYEAAIDAKLERAAWPLRASEFLAIRGASAFGALVLVWIVTSSPLVALVVGVVGWFAPRFVLDRRIDKRIGAFHAQLPDTMTLLAASLESGYGLMQGLDLVVHESPAPTSEEFARTLTEIRLGMPVHDALDAMADRIGSEDFRWVVMSMNIQREVGGNLVHVLRTVADTLRERDELRRNVKVLSAEGRLSGAILAILPFVLAGYMWVANPRYLGILLESSIGRVFIVGALTLIGVGALWMRKIVRMDV